MPSTRSVAESIERFAFDVPEDTEPFSRRLARENGWSREFAGRVIREYRRFLTLAVTAGHPVVPSDEVDQAWHLHLLDSVGYRRFCEEILRHPLDHHPSRGGLLSRQRLIGAYRQTLSSYRARFGEAPPKDVWPASDERFGARARASRIKLQAYWLVRKPVFRSSAASFISARLTGSLMAVLAMALAGCAMHRPTRGSLTGPEFLGLYLGAWLAGVIVAWGLKNRRAVVADADLPEVHPYEVAHLSGGPLLALDSVLTSLIARQKLVCDLNTAVLRVSPQAFEPSHPFEQAVFSCVAQAEGLGVAALRRRAQELAIPLGERLEALGLTGRGSWLPFWIALIGPAVGGLRVLSRLGSDRPVGGLTLLCLLGVWLAWLAFAPSSPRTASGDAVLARLRQGHQPLAELSSTGDSSAAGPLTLSVALFGLGSLANTGLSEWSALVAAQGTASNHGDGDSDGDGGAGADGGCCGCGGCGGGCE